MCIILYMIYDVDINYRMICSFLGDPMAVVLNSSVYNRQFTASKFQPRQAKLYAVGTHGYFSKDASEKVAKMIAELGLEACSLKHCDEFAASIFSLCHSQYYSRTWCKTVDMAMQRGDLW